MEILLFILLNTFSITAEEFNSLSQDEQQVLIEEAKLDGGGWELEEADTK
jgi:hypothetical protein